MKIGLPTCFLFFWMTFLTGIVYPFLVTLIANVFFFHQSQGSLIQTNEKIVGSSLIAQSFKDPKYFWPRPSLNEYHLMPSKGSDLFPTSVALQQNVVARKNVFKDKWMPKELLLYSASGLDPHISVEAALFQVNRIAEKRNINPKKLKELVHHQIEPLSGFLSVPYINVLLLNLTLDSYEF